MFQHTFAFSVDIFTFFSGELPKELGELINLKVLYLSDNKIGGKLYAPAYMACVFVNMFHFLAGKLPKKLGHLINLKELKLLLNEFGGKLYVPYYTRNLIMRTIPNPQVLSVPAQ